MTNPVIGWAKDNPLAAGAAAVGVLVVVMLVSGGGSEETDGASGGTGTAGMQSYYAAVAQQGQAGAAIQIAQINANADTNKALIASTYGIESAKIWAPVSIATTQANAATDAANIAASREVSIATLEHQHAMYDNYINLQNSQITSTQNIAFKQANVANAANKRSFIGGLFNTVVGAGMAVATGGASLVPSAVAGATNGKAAVKLPALGSSGSWV